MHHLPRYWSSHLSIAALCYRLGALGVGVNVRQDRRRNVAVLQHSQPHRIQRAAGSAQHSCNRAQMATSACCGLLNIQKKQNHLTSIAWDCCASTLKVHDAQPGTRQGFHPHAELKLVQGWSQCPPERTRPRTQRTAGARADGDSLASFRTNPTAGGSSASDSIGSACR